MFRLLAWTDGLERSVVASYCSQRRALTMLSYTSAILKSMSGLGLLYILIAVFSSLAMVS